MLTTKNKHGHDNVSALNSSVTISKLLCHVVQKLNKGLCRTTGATFQKNFPNNVGRFLCVITLMTRLSALENESCIIKSASFETTKLFFVIIVCRQGLHLFNDVNKSVAPWHQVRRVVFIKLFQSVSRFFVFIKVANKDTSRDLKSVNTRLSVSFNPEGDEVTYQSQVVINLSQTLMIADGTTFICVGRNGSLKNGGGWSSYVIDVRLKRAFRCGLWVSHEKCAYLRPKVVLTLAFAQVVTPIGDKVTYR